MFTIAQAETGYCHSLPVNSQHTDLKTRFNDIFLPLKIIDFTINFLPYSTQFFGSWIFLNRLIMADFPSIKLNLPHSRFKNSLTQISDFFSEFGPLSPAVQHDR